MAWSAKLQSGSGGVQGYNEWQLYFNASTQTVYKVTYQLQLGDEAPDVLYHTPDNGSPIPVRATGRNRVIFLEMHITNQSSWDNVLNAIAPISRLVNGPDSQAVRASTTGAAENVRVAIQPDGATNATYFDVLHGFVDTSTAFTSPAAVLNTAAYKVVIALTCKPYGYGDGFTLRNDLGSSPHFIEGNNANGVGDGFTQWSTPTETVLSDLYLIGGMSQKITSDSGSGIVSDVVTAALSSDLVAYLWIYSSAIANINVSLLDGSNNVIDTLVCSTATADKSAIDNGGRTWYRFVVSGVNSTAIGARIRTTSATAGKVWYVDAAYLQVGTLIAPDGWCSSSSLKNRYDPANTTAATRQQINYLDTWGIPGDSPAYFDTFINQTSTPADGFITGKISDGVELANNWYHWLDSEQFAVVTGGCTLATGTGTTKDDYLRWTASGSATTNYPTGIPYATDSLYWDGFDEWLAKVPVRVYALGRTSSLSNLLRLSWTGAKAGNSGYLSFSATNTWELLDMGLINATSESQSGALVIPSLNIVFSSGTLDVDALIFLPADDDGIMSVPYTDGTAVAPYFYTYGAKDYVTHSNNIGLVLSADILVEHAGSFRTLAPGASMTRLLFLMSGTYATNRYTFDIANTTNITMGVIPRTSHLLGTA